MVVHLICQCGNDVSIPDSPSGSSIRCSRCGRMLSASSGDSNTPDPNENRWSEETQVFNRSEDQESDHPATRIDGESGKAETARNDDDLSTDEYKTVHGFEPKTKSGIESQIKKRKTGLVSSADLSQTGPSTGAEAGSEDDVTQFDLPSPRKISERVIVEAPDDATQILDPSSKPGADDDHFDLVPDDPNETKIASVVPLSGDSSGGSRHGSRGGSKIADLDLSERVMGTISKPSVPLSSASGDTGDYGVHRILRTHQKGGMGRILIAYDQFLKRDIALKELHPEVAEDISIVRRFIGEAEITAQLEHPGVVPIHVLGRDREGLPYYTMKLIKGITYQEAIKAYHRNPNRQELMHLIRRLVSICKTIAFAHNKGVIHRDLKPANIMLGEHGETLVMDWGLAKPIGAVHPDDTSYASTAIEHHASEPRPELTMVGAVVGTPAFMSPEQASPENNTVGPLSDIFSLGTILYYLLAGQTAFSGRSTQEVLGKVRAASPPKPSEIKPGAPAGLEAICAKAMAKKPEDRYQSASEMDADLCRWLDGEPVKAQKETFFQSIHRWIDRHRLLTFAIPLALIVLIIFVNIAVYLDRIDRYSVEAEIMRKVLNSTTDLTDESSVEFRGSPGVVLKRESRLTGGEMISCRVEVVPRSEHGVVTITAPGGASWDLTHRSQFQFSIYEDLTPTQPEDDAPLSAMFIRMGRGSSFFEYTPDPAWWKTRKIRNWYAHAVPLEGSQAWIIREFGIPLMSDIEWVEIHFTVKATTSFQLDNISFLDKDR